MNSILKGLRYLIESHNLVDYVSIITEIKDYDGSAVCEALDFYSHKGNYSLHTLIENRVWIGKYYNGIEAIIIDDRIERRDFSKEALQKIIKELQNLERWKMEERHSLELEELYEVEIDCFI